MEFNKVRCWVPHFGLNDPLQHYRLEEEWLQAYLAEKGLEMLFCIWLNMNQLCLDGQEGQWHPGLDLKQCGQQDQGRGYPSVLDTSEAASRALCPVLCPSLKQGH